MKPNKAGTGEYLQLKFEVLEGEYQKRLLWVWLNLKHPNPTAVKLAQAELSAICRAVSLMNPGDSEELHNLPMLIKVRVKKRSDTGELTNEISKYSAKPSAQLGGPPDGNDAPPWKPQ